MEEKAVKRGFIPNVGSFALICFMLLSSLMLWIAVPLGWLWVGSQVQAATDSLGYALLSIVVGVALSIALLVWVLGGLNRRYMSLRGETHSSGFGALEIVLVSTAVVAVAAFMVWFVAFSGTSPMPLNIGY